MSVKIEQSGDCLKSNLCKKDEKQVNSKLNNKKRNFNSIRTSPPPPIATTNNISNHHHLIDNNNFNQQQSSIIMSDSESMFIIGSIVIVETGWGHSFEGEVIAFDYKYKILLLKCPALSGNTTRNDIHLVNLDCAKNVTLKKEAKKKDHTNNPQIEIEKVEQRKNSAINERKRLVSAFKAGINEDGLKLYLHLSKTLGTTFEGKNVIVMNSVLITHPYKVDNCVSLPPASNSAEKKLKNEDAVDYVKKLVDKFWQENQ